MAVRIWPPFSVKAIYMSDKSYYKVCAVDDLLPGERLFIELGDEPVVIFNIDGEYLAIGDICTHDDGPLGDGEVEGHEVICPRHGARFDVRTGQVTALPAVKGVPSYPVRVREGMVEIGVVD